MLPATETTSCHLPDLGRPALGCLRRSGMENTAENRTGRSGIGCDRLVWRQTDLFPDTRGHFGICRRWKPVYRTYSVSRRLYPDRILAWRTPDPVRRRSSPAENHQVRPGLRHQYRQPAVQGGSWRKGHPGGLRWLPVTVLRSSWSASPAGAGTISAGCENSRQTLSPEQPSVCLPGSHGCHGSQNPGKVLGVSRGAFGKPQCPEWRKNPVHRQGAWPGHGPLSGWQQITGQPGLYTGGYQWCPQSRRPRDPDRFH